MFVSSGRMERGAGGAWDVCRESNGSELTGGVLWGVI